MPFNCVASKKVTRHLGIYLHVKDATFIFQDHSPLLLSRAFDLNDDSNESFRISYYCANEWLPMLSDWDLDAAVISASDPCLQLALVKASQRDKVNLRVFESSTGQEAKVSSESAISPTAAAAQEAIHQLFVTSKQSFLKSTIPALTNKLQRMVTTPNEDQNQQSQQQLLLNPPLSDREFRSFLDNVGELVRPRELRIVIYKGGVEPALRKVVWKHLLGVYPNGLDGRQRLEYMRHKSYEYDKLKNSWMEIVTSGQLTDEIKMVTNMIRKDVLRTDLYFYLFGINPQKETKMVILYSMMLYNEEKKDLSIKSCYKL